MQVFSQVLKMIEEQSDFHFLYRSDYFDEVPEVTIETEDAKLEDVLNKIIVPYGFAFEIDDKTVVIRKSDEPRTIEISAPQKKIVSGKVTDSSGATLPGVSVVVKGTTLGIITDANGTYSISNIPENAVLQFSFVGMKTQEISVSGKTTISVVMAEETIGLEEVIAVGYGVQKKGDITGSVASVKMDKLKEAPQVNLAPGVAGEGSRTHYYSK